MISSFFRREKLKKGLVFIFILIFSAVLGLLTYNFGNLKSTAEVNQPSPCKYLLSYDRDGGDPKYANDDYKKGVSPTYVAENMSRLESYATPYDGIVIHEHLASEHIFRNEVVTTDQIVADLQPLFSLGFTPRKYRHNMIRVWIHYPDDFYDGGWEQVADNMASLSSAIKQLNEAGFPVDGIFFDNEGPYDTRPHVMWNFPRGTGDRNNDATLIKYPERGLIAYQAQSRARGKLIMDHMVQAWPDIKVMPLLDAHFSCVGSNGNGADLYDYDELIGSFTLGMVESTVGYSAKVIDGGEYAYYIGSSDSAFSNYYYKKKYAMPANQPNCSFMKNPTDATNIWLQNAEVGFGIYDGTQFDIIKDTVTSALNHADRYVWLYTEYNSSIDPLQTNYIGDTFTTNVRTGKAAAAKNQDYCDPALPVLLNLSINLQSRTDHSTAGTRLKIYGGGNLILDKTDVSTDANGHAQLTLPTTMHVDSVYDFYIKAKYFLADYKGNQILTDPMNLTYSPLKGGDLDDNNMINSIDFSVLLSKWAQTNLIADINKDGVVNSADFAVMSSNWLLGS